MRNKKAMTLIEIMIVVAIIAVLAAISIPNIIRSRINANEAAAQSIMRTIIDSCSSYRAVNPSYPTELSELSGAVPPYMSDTVCGDGLSNGYQFALEGEPNTFELTADPEIPGQTGQHYFYADHSGVITVGDSSFAGEGDGGGDEAGGGDEGDRGEEETSPGIGF